MNRKVRVISDNDCYDSFRDKVLIITHVAYNTDEHPGYDDGVKPQALCDFKTIDGEDVPCSLYEYEFTTI